MLQKVKEGKKCQIQGYQIKPYSYNSYPEILDSCICIKLGLDRVHRRLITFTLLVLSTLQQSIRVVSKAALRHKHWIQQLTRALNTLLE